MRVVSEGSLRGVPEDLNSLDWDGKHLRAVTKLTTAVSATCVEIRDSEALEAVAKEENRCSITVLDGDLEILGELEDCPGVDYIYSVRFDGDLVYLLNYSASSPLAAFDLSDPGSPKPLSESASAKARRDLKGDLLLAVGQSASRHTSVSLFPLGSALSPKPCAVNVSERYRGVYFTRDPSAVFCDPENSLTGFYAGGTFYFYRYDPDSVSFTETSVDLSPLSGVNDVRAFGACGSVFILSHRALIRLDADTLSPVKEELFFPASGSGFLRTSPENRQPELALPAYYY
ncbi:MAG: beta-propeller domain-containing protein, partial [Clostridia bacterium]|nr:beta-propeller domain-containing protein [Clostridia bacterium]